MAIDTRNLADETRDWVADTTATVRGWLDHPRASQALLLTSVALLLFMGSMMVLSASSVLSYTKNNGNSYQIFLPGTRHEPTSSRVRQEGSRP